MTPEEAVTEAREVLDLLPDEIQVDDVLSLLGMEEVARTAWHRSRVIDALVGTGGEWTAFKTPNGLRFRRRTVSVLSD